jgi:glutamyl-tRNA reductase
MMNGLKASADIRNLVVAHWLKDANSSAHAMPRVGLFLDTCLRQLNIQVSPDALAIDDAENRTGIDAYRFVLEITTGLRSAVPGETNVFGQFKQAWERFRHNGQAAQVARLAPLVHGIINDTKTIRRAHLQGIGGASYGTLVRRLIRPEASDRILFVGAGYLARSMLPLFRNYALGIWNRRVMHSQTLPIGKVFRPVDGERSARWADHVILTTPPDDANDANWRRWLASGNARTVVHLGHRRSHGTLISEPGIRSFDLDDVFDLRHAQADARSRQLTHARRACKQCAVDYIRDDRNPGFTRLKTA